MAAPLFGAGLQTPPTLQPKVSLLLTHHLFTHRQLPQKLPQKVVLRITVP
jgi:hypothetical protein